MGIKKDIIEQDAKGQYAKSIGDRRATGVASAKPTVITGSEDGTAHKMPPDAKGRVPESPDHHDPAERNEDTLRRSR
ncbi:hypothetical protein LH464_14735 [Neorhizobium sp. T786]|uniref:hypothetical protein n=1 Tax=Pseudorhizobium xiangyangii TaxID=2883104 RepID=UPI001CFFA127|nr:hypothetical protein [Neorhizobium xiangyangii]MCB5203731.1 hypothetical protein [Neorhizobium xiangyangii]